MNKETWLNLKKKDKIGTELARRSRRDLDLTTSWYDHTIPRRGKVKAEMMIMEKVESLRI